MSWITARLWLYLPLLACAVSVLAQQPAVPASSSSTVVVPPLVSFSGVLTNGNGQPLTGVVGVTFTLYAEQQGGAPLWLETQNVYPDKTGHYTVMLGSTSSTGIPSQIFASGEARWLGVQPQGQPEQPRVSVLSVPYAMEAANAQTVGGLPASAFVLAAPPNASPQNPSSPAPANSPAGPNVGGSGTEDYIPLWIDNSGDLGNSILYQSGTTAVGINTTTPAATLDVNGGVISRGSLQLPSTGTATASQGYNSQPLEATASVFNSTTGTAVPENFYWQAEPLNNDQSTATGTLNLLFATGSNKAAETGLNIASTGLITFAKGQSFPGTGTITGVTAGTGLTGGGTSGNVTLSINVPFANKYYAQLAAPNTFTANQTVNANLTAQQLISTVAQGTAPLQVTSTTQVPNLNASLLGGLSASAFAQLVASNTFTGNQTVNGNLSATGVVTGSSYQIGSNLFAYGSAASYDAFLGFAGNSTTTGINDTATGYQALLSDTTGNDNTASGFSALFSNTSGSGNVGTGYRALYSNTSGGGNTASGINALYSNTTGGFNTADGNGALQLNTTGADNTASGSTALFNNAGGTENTADGYSALGANTTGNSNSAVGFSALVTNTTGSDNTAVGFFAGPDSNSTGLTNSTAIGAYSVVSENNALVLGCASGVNGCPAAVNVGIGTATPAYTLDVQGSGRFTQPVLFAANQTFPGAGTITGVTAGTGLSGGGTSGTVTLANTGILGVTAGTGISSSGGQTPTIGINTSVVPQLNAANTFSGNQTVDGNLSATGTVTGSSYQIGSNLFDYGSYSLGNAFLGFAGNTTMTGTDNTASGDSALYSNTTGSENTASGYQALYLNTTGSNNTASGAYALFTNTTGIDDTANGYGALTFNTAGSNDTASGYEALYSNTTGSENTASGYQALYLNTTGYGNSAFGYQALSSVIAGGPPIFNIGYLNTAIGYQALLYNNSGNGNTASGYWALVSNQGGNYNTATGYGALLFNTLGNYNTASGFEALANSTGNYNVGLGYMAGYDLNTGSNNIDISNEGATSESGVIRIGTQGTQTATYIAGIYNANVGGNAVYVNSSGQLSSLSSSRRFKQDIRDLGNTTKQVMGLRPVRFRYKSQGPEGADQYGLIAEEVDKVAPDLVGRGQDGQIDSVRYDKVNILLLNEVQKQHRLIEEQKQKLQARIREQQQQIRTQQTQLKAQLAKSKLQDAQIAELMSQVKAIQASLKTSGHTGSEVRTVRAQVPMVQQ